MSRRRADQALAAIRHTAWGCLAAIGLWAWLATPAGAAEATLGPGAAPAEQPEPWAAPVSTLVLLLLAAAIGTIRSRRPARRDTRR